MKGMVFFLILALLAPFQALAESSDEFQKIKARAEEPELVRRGELDLMPRKIIVEQIKNKGQVDFASNFILFDYGSWKLRESSYRQLTEIAEAIKDPALREIPFFYVDGHTCSIGSDENNCTLSWRRARSIVNFLVDAGRVPRNKLVDRGFGKREPAASNDTDDGRQQNRRVVLKSSLTEDGTSKEKICQ
jgi:outer membrane protein OmpA-like peptidoglycan-associated protein